MSVDTQHNRAASSQAARTDRMARRFYAQFKAEWEAFQQQIRGIDDENDRHWYASLLLTRAICCRFLQAKGLLARDPAPLQMLFGQHTLDLKYPAMQIADGAFDRLARFLDAYQWRLDERTPASDTEITPHVLGFILEKHVNQREMGAYYTGPDVTEYMGRNTLFLFLLTEAKRACPSAFAGLPPTEVMVTANVDLQRFARDLCANADDPALLNALYCALSQVTVLDPTCGSGAFLLAALDLLEPLYRTCLDRMEALLERGLAAPAFETLLEQVRQYPNRTYFIRHSIITRNLYGVDLMPEAVDICRMRLYLKMAASVDKAEDLKPLSDTPLNLWSGNALVGFDWSAAFPAISRRGGFDVILGNPPYLELREVDYKPEGFKSAGTGAIHAMCVERSLQLLQPQGAISMIVPMALVSTQRMVVVQQMLEQSGRTVWYSNYAWRPGKLFETVNRALTIFIAAPGSGRTFSTNYQKWTAETRDLLMQSLTYTEIPRERPSFWAPKLGHPLEAGILRKLLALPTTMGHFLAPSQHRIYYRTTGGLYWKVFTDFAPAFTVNGKPGPSSRETSMTLRDALMVRPALATLSSDLFWWWYTITSNLRDLNPSDIKGFPVPESALKDPRLAELGAEYMADLIRNSTMRRRVQKQTGVTETQSFKIAKSKPIIDRIDAVLAEHYGLDAAELAFVSGYDAKFRLSGSEDEE